ncbi:competence protein CoiA family protein [Anaerosporobacter sp.]|uniref:competence protein CoiA family protein n=1 Tax=Anaerosporobacter sp. TaxID=1872529 RepID=UPI00286F01CA|nr:competence protein CoiA family protein [Anaerosporobacter sp.]
MVTQENAFYHNELWCAYELKDYLGRYKEELRLHMRMASQNHELICPDCKEAIILCAGMIREPYFRHHAETDCKTRSNGNKGDYPIARRLLYQLAKRSFPDAEVYCSKDVGKYVADIYVNNNDKQIAMEYLSYDMKLNEWLEKHAFYEKEGITDIWFLNSKKYRFEAPTTFEYLIATKKYILNILDTSTAEITLKKILRLQGQSVGKVVARTYFLPELMIDEEGCLQCDFEEYVEALLDRETQIRENRLSKYPVPLRVALEDRKKAMEAELLDEDDKDEKGMGDNIENNMSTMSRLSPYEVHRFPITDANLTALTMKMPALEECWVIPKLRGEGWEIEGGNKERFDYLHDLNNRLYAVEDEDQREQMIDEAVFYLEEMLEAKRW